MKIFEKLLNKYLETHNEHMEKLCRNQELICKRLGEIDDVLPKNNSGLVVEGGLYANICSAESWESNMNNIIKEDYFTKEYINEEATNTETLYVIKGDSMQKYLFRKGNESQDVKFIDGKNYLFLK